MHFYLKRDSTFPDVMSSPLYINVDICWSKPFRGAAVMDGLVAMEEHKLIGCGGYHIVHWRHGFCSYISSKDLPLKMWSHAYTHLCFLFFLTFNVLYVVLFPQIGILIAPRKQWLTVKSITFQEIKTWPFYSLFTSSQLCMHLNTLSYLHPVITVLIGHSYNGGTKSPPYSPSHSDCKHQC